MFIPIVFIVASAFAGKKAYDNHKKAKRGNSPAGGVAVNGLPTSGPQAPIGITPAGIPQPEGKIVALAPQIDIPKDLHDSAANLVQRLSTMGDSGQTTEETKEFQSSYNDSNPETPLLVDGQYSTKTQAVLQSVIVPAVAPHPFIFSSIVAPPANPAPSPNLGVAQDIRHAANALYDFLVKGGNKKGSFREVTTFQTAWNSHHKNQPLIADGMYGSNCQNALQAVLTWMHAHKSGNKRKAPKSVYGGKVTQVIFIP